MSEPTNKQINTAALAWCAGKEREFSLDDVRYFEQNWRSLPGLRAYVEQVQAEQRGYRRGVQDAARLAQEHRARVPNHHPDEPMDDLVAQGYGNAALNLECAILALLDKPKLSEPPHNE